MLGKRLLGDAFRLYWDDMSRCQLSGAYWSLLHVAVCLPDICSALESATGETTGALYQSWCDENLKEPLLTGSELYRMRCRVLHQGRASLGRPGRYSGFSFGQPGPNGEIDHLRVSGTELFLDVGQLSAQLRRAVESWISRLEAAPDDPPAVNAQRNLESLVRVAKSSMLSQPPDLPPVNLRTN